MNRATFDMAAGSQPLDASAVLNIVERFSEEIEKQQRRRQQVGLLLETISEDTAAEAVLWFSGRENRVHECVSRKALSITAYCNLINQSLGDCPEANGQLLLSPLEIPDWTDGAAPTSLAMVQMGKNSSSWVCAFTYGENRLGEIDLRVMKVAARLLLQHRNYLQSIDKFQQTMYGLLLSLTAAIDAKDPYTCGHSERVARIAARIGQEMGLSDALVSDLRLGGLLHDVGKIGIADGVLRKAGKLSPHEFEVIKQHPVYGDNIIGQVKQLAHLRPMVRNHHERFDGAGYPDGLAGEEIPLLARIVAVADACDAMMRDRTYRPTIPKEKILKIFQEGCDTQWDGRVVRHFFNCYQEIFGIYEKGLGKSFFVAVQNTGKSRQL